MKDVKQASLIAALVVAGAFGCSSSGGAKSGTGGSNASGGSTGSGGHLGGGGGGGKACGGPAPTADAGVCQQAPCDGLIADFSSADAGIPIMGAVTTWSGVVQPTYTIADGMLTVNEAVSQSGVPQYLGTTLYFYNCVDASGFTGVQFTISGSISAACHLIFAANDVAHDNWRKDPKGTCDAGDSCYAPNMMVPMQVTSTPTVIKMPWIEGSSVPDVALDPAHLVGVQWQFTVDPTADGGTAQDCTAELHIDDVKFY